MSPRDGFLLVDKPAGLTSFGAVAIARGALRAELGGPRPRVGHTGSLDPLATGLLVLLVGAATRLSPFLTHLDKTYRLRARFGAATDSLDADGEVGERRPVARGPDELAAALAGFRGAIDQVPPAISALKRGGERLYRIARSGGELPDLAPRRVRITRLDLDATRWGETPAAGESPAFLAPDGRLYEADLVVDCSGGTYVRALVRDVAAALGTVGHVRALRRERVGPFVVGDALPADRLRDGAALAAALRPCAQALPHLPAIRLRRDEARAVRQGSQPEPAWLARLDGPPAPDPRGGDEWMRLTDESGELVAVAGRPPGGFPLRLLAVFAQEGASS